MKPKREAERGTREWDVCVRVEERRVLGDGGSGRGNVWKKKVYIFGSI